MQQQLIFAQIHNSNKSTKFGLLLNDTSIQLKFLGTVFDLKYFKIIMQFSRTNLMRQLPQVTSIVFYSGNFIKVKTIYINYTIATCWMLVLYVYKNCYNLTRHNKFFLYIVSMSQVTKGVFFTHIIKCQTTLQHMGCNHFDSIILCMYVM